MASNAAMLAPDRGVLQDLLHVLSQPLTTLHCALEHSLEADEAQANDVVLALEQTERVIEAVRLMRQYLEAEEGNFLAELFPLGLATENVLEQLSMLAEARGLQLFAFGTSKATIPVKDAWVQRALLYLFVMLLESVPAGRAIVVLLEDRSEQCVISGHSLPAKATGDGALPYTLQPNTFQQVKIAIARRVLASSGGSVEFYCDGKPGFTIRIPQMQTKSATDQLIA
jgi:hypothetical protein